MVMSRDRNAGRGYSVKIDNSSIERVEKFKYLGTTLTDQNSIQEEIKSRLNLGNACYYSVQNLLSSRLLSRNLKINIYRTIILSVVLYGCKTWSLTLREERRLRVFENRVLRRVFGPKRDEVTGEWRKLHNEKLNDLYPLPNIVRVVKSKRMRWSGHVARMGEDRVVHRVLVGKPKGKRPLGRPRHRWEDNIKIDLQKVGWGCGDWMELAQDRDRWRALVCMVRNFQVP
jgi:hypothetical protein